MNNTYNSIDYKDKKLLLKDLCAMLPYGVYVEHTTTKIRGELKGIVFEHIYNDTDSIQDINAQVMFFGDEYVDATYFRPFLRPMSSMTEEEKEELKNKCIHTETEEDWEGVRSDVWGIQILDKYDTRRWDNPIWPSTINTDAIDWLEKKGEQKTDEWSEEDKKMIDTIIETIKMSIEDCDVDDIGTKARLSLEKERDWLKSLKDRVQPKSQSAEWSEEDIVAIDCAVEVLSKDLPSLAASIERLKSLRPQKQWRPSEMEMKALEFCLEHNIENSFHGIVSFEKFGCFYAK